MHRSNPSCPAGGMVELVSSYFLYLVQYTLVVVADGSGYNDQAGGTGGPGGGGCGEQNIPSTVMVQQELQIQEEVVVDLLIIQVDLHIQVGAGGSGIVITKELNKASGVWSMQSAFQNQTAGTWPDGSVGIECRLDYMVVAAGGGGGAGLMRRWSVAELVDIELLVMDLLLYRICFIWITLQMVLITITVGGGGTGGTTPGWCLYGRRFRY